MTDKHVCEQLAQSRYVKVEQPESRTLDLCIACPTHVAVYYVRLRFV